jgi:hypothetical protein
MSGIDWRFTVGRVGNEPRTTYLGQLFLGSVGFDSDRYLTLEVEYVFEFAIEQTPLSGLQQAASVAYRVHASGQPTSLSLSTGPIGSIVSGVGAPILTGGPSWQDGTAVVAFDIGSRAEGTLTQRANTSKTGTTPSALLAGALIDFACYNSTGSYLGMTSADEVGEITTGAATGAGLLTEGGLAEMTQSVILSKLVNAFSGVRYLAPLVKQTVSGDGHTWTAWYD